MRPAGEAIQKEAAWVPPCSWIATVVPLARNSLAMTIMITTLTQRSANLKIPNLSDLESDRFCSKSLPAKFNRLLLRVKALEVMHRFPAEQAFSFVGRELSHRKPAANMKDFIRAWHRRRAQPAQKGIPEVLPRR